VAEQAALKESLAALPAGVVVVSTHFAGGFAGLTATSFTSVSVEPPLVLACLDSFARTRDAVAEAGEFSVSVLERSQEFLAERFAGRAPLVDPGWRDVSHGLSPGGLPILGGCVAWFECRLTELRAAGDHDICLGEVRACGRRQGEPLVLWNRSFWSLA
jgi:flavin reductase (DIM6/NTAB) family NADH-FMN oxidoreductase RutF